MASAAANTLVFLCYGAGRHVDEALFSLLTLRRFPADAMRDIAVRVVTDQVNRFAGEGFEVVPVPAQTFEEWKGPARYHHRCKIVTMKHVLGEFGGKCILVDGDTHFLRPPARLFDRVGPGRSLLHRTEGRLADSRHAFNHELGEVLRDRSPGHPAAIGRTQGPATMQWNSGVVGLDRADVARMDEALELMDYFRSRMFAPILEQMAFTIALCGPTRVASARDVVFHYCTSPLRDEFRSKLPGLLAESASMPSAERAQWLYAHRLRPSLALKMRNRLKDVLNVTGIYPARDRAECC